MCFLGSVICISGKLSKSRKEITQMIEENGGEVTRSISKMVTHLVTTEDALNDETSKVSKAEHLKIPVVSEQWLTDSIDKGKVQETSSYELGSEENKDDEEPEEKPKKQKKEHNFKLEGIKYLFSAEDCKTLPKWQLNQILHSNTCDGSWQKLEEIFDMDLASEGDTLAIDDSEGLTIGTIEDIDSKEKFQIVRYAAGDNTAGKIYKDKQTRGSWEISDTFVGDDYMQAAFDYCENHTKYGMKH